MARDTSRPFVFGTVSISSGSLEGRQSANLVVHAVGCRLRKDNSLGKLDTADLDRTGSAIPYPQNPSLDGCHGVPALLVIGVVDSESKPPH
jgi:hypothetical protein